MRWVLTFAHMKVKKNIHWHKDISDQADKNKILRYCMHSQKAWHFGSISRNWNLWNTKKLHPVCPSKCEPEPEGCQAAFLTFAPLPFAFTPLFFLSFLERLAESLKNAPKIDLGWAIPLTNPHITYWTWISRFMSWMFSFGAKLQYENVKRRMKANILAKPSSYLSNRYNQGKNMLKQHSKETKTLKKHLE